MIYSGLQSSSCWMFCITCAVTTIWTVRSLRNFLFEEYHSDWIGYSRTLVLKIHPSIPFFMKLMSVTAIKRLNISFIEVNIFLLYLELLYECYSLIRHRIHPGPRWLFRFVKLRSSNWLGHLQRMSDHRKHKKDPEWRNVWHKEARTTIKRLDNRYRGGLQEDEHPALAREGPRSTGLEEDCEADQGPPRTVVPEWWWCWWWWWLW